MERVLPYDAASTGIGSEQLAPASLEGALGYKYEDVLYDPIQDKFLNKEEYLKTVKEDPGGLWLSSFRRARSGCRSG